MTELIASKWMLYAVMKSPIVAFFCSHSKLGALNPDVWAEKDQKKTNQTKGDKKSNLIGADRIEESEKNY